MGFFMAHCCRFSIYGKNTGGRGLKGAKDAVPGLSGAICADWVGEGRGMLCVFAQTAIMPGVYWCLIRH